jgi:hypothetical protein
MAKFAKLKNALPLGPARAIATAFTGNGGRGHAVDAKTALYTLAVTNMVPRLRTTRLRLSVTNVLPSSFIT